MDVFAGLFFSVHASVAPRAGKIIVDCSSKLPMISKKIVEEIFERKKNL